MIAQSSRTAVIVPAFNAAHSLPELIGRIGAVLPAGNIVVIDDGSTDDTEAVMARLRVLSIRHRANMGKGAALRTGFAFVSRMPWFSHALTLDADLQHAPEDIAGLLECQAQTGADIILGRRRRLGGHMPLARILSNSITSFLVSARTGQRVEDSQCGFRLIDRRVIEQIRFTSSGYEAETEFLIRAAQLGFQFASASVQTIYSGEKSYMTHWHTTKAFLRVLLRSD